MDNQDAFSRNSGNSHFSERLTQLLLEQVEAHSRGMGFPFLSGEVFPHDSTPPSVISPAQAWDDAILAASFFGNAEDFGKAPPDWPVLMTHLSSLVAIPFCLGNFPQLARQFRPFLEEPLLESDFIQSGFFPSERFEKWLTDDTGEKSPYLRAAMDRLLGNYERAESLLARDVSVKASDFDSNERAALAWHCGDHQKALSIWQDLPDSVPICFNRGLAHLFLGDRGQAQRWLGLAAAGLPETSAWHHLACLYRTLAEG